MKNFKKFTVLSMLLAACASYGQAFIENPGFEKGKAGWREPYIPADSTTKGCRFDISTDSPHEGIYCAVLESSDDGRISISPSAMPLPVQPGDQYKITAWVRVGRGFSVERNQPGMLIRADLLEGNTSRGVFTCNWQGKSAILQGNESLAQFVTPALPDTWTKVETVLTIPQDVSRIRLSLFLWRASGTLYVDDFQIERIFAGQ